MRFHIYYCLGSPHQMYSGAFAISVFETDHEMFLICTTFMILKGRWQDLGTVLVGRWGARCSAKWNVASFCSQKKNPQMLNMLRRKRISTSVSIWAIAGYCKFWDQLHTTTWVCSCPHRVSWPAFGCQQKKRPMAINEAWEHPADRWGQSPDL